MPTLPTSAAIARTMAAGVLLSAAALTIAPTAALVLAAVRVMLAGDARLALDGAGLVLVVAGVATACAATLAVPVWPWPARRPATLALAAIVTAAWPLSGHALLASALAIVAVGLALVRDHRATGGRHATSWRLAGALGLPAVALAITGVALADAHPLHPQRAPAPKAGAGRPDTSRHGGGATHSGGQSPSAAADTSHGGESADGAGTASDHATSPTPGSPGDEATPAEDPPAADAPAAATPEPAEDPPATHAPTSAQPDADAATRFVRDYYTALNERRYEDAWAELSPTLRTQFGGFARWKGGYAQTLESEPTHLTTRADGNAVIVSLRLVAHERNCNRAQNFRVTWRLERVSGQWSVAGLRGSVIGSPSCE